MFSRILIVKLSSLGDVVHTLPAVQALRARFPEARLFWAVERAHSGVLRGSTLVDEVIEWNRGAPGGFRDFVRRIRARKYDLAIDFQGLFRSALVTRLSGAPRRLGFAPGREFSHLFYNQRIARPREALHAVERSLRLVESLGATLLGTRQKSEAIDGLFPLPIGGDEREAVEAWLCERRIDLARQRLVILNPHCRNEANLWPTSHFAALAARLADHADLRVVLTGGPASREVCDEIAQALGDRIARADGALSILGSAELIRRAALFITGDTGPMHLAAAVAAPMIALFGPTDPRRTGPYASDVVAMRRGLSCSPCLKRQCPLGHVRPPCMTELTVDDVYAAAVTRLFEADGFSRKQSA